jgi:hypothetical protein
MFDQSFLGPPPLSAGVEVVLTLWLVILVPWVPAFTLIGTGMAFEGGYTVDAFLFVIGAWAYPILVAVAYYLRRRKPQLVYLPILTLIPMFASSVTHPR